jgi:hypothetical protein
MAAAMLAAASAHAGHVPGAHYTGMAASGATVQLDVLRTIVIRRLLYLFK